MKTAFKKSMVTLTLLMSSSIAYCTEIPKKGIVFFQENKGQICDQNFKSRPDVLFSGTANGLVYHLTQRGISYQLSKIDKWKEVAGKNLESKIKVPDATTIYRVDINWIGINQHSKIVTGQELPSRDNYYFPQCPNGALNVKSYSDLVYSNIYNGIDLKWYSKNGELEYDFMVEPKVDVSKIKFEIKGAVKLNINENGELEIKTPLGTIIEKAPIAYQNEKEVKAEWQFEGNTLSFKIGDYNKNEILIIDPAIRSWATYYGSSGLEITNTCLSDVSGNIYIGGSSATSTVIATVGAQQTTFGGGSSDGFIAKFNSAGIRQWGTFYGGTGNDVFYDFATDASGNIYATGETSSSTAIATVGSHQSSFAGGVTDAMLVKFNSTGTLQWGTYYGTNSGEWGRACSIDGLGNVYIGGYTGAVSAGTAIATVGSYQSSNAGLGFNDGFLVKFNSAGVRQWGTFYGGVGDDYIYGMRVNSAGDVYLCGQAAATSGTVLASVGAHQTTNFGAGEAFMAKFNTSGVRQWGTYYGEAGLDVGRDCALDPLGDIYFIGSTSSTLNIASAGAFQTSLGGSSDAFIVRFNSAGTRQWGTYFGGSAADVGWACSVNASSEIYMSGTTSSTANIATPGAHQITLGGVGSDGFLSKLTSTGALLYSTYYGGTAVDEGYAVDAKSLNTIYLAGYSQSANAISTVAAHQPTFGGTGDAYLVKFIECPNLTLAVTGNTSICIGQSTTLTAVGSGFTSYSWTPTSVTTVTAALNPTTTTTYTLLAGTSTLGCTYSNTKTVSVNPKPTISVVDTHPGGLQCPGFTYTVYALGASTYTWNSGATTSSIVVSPTVPTSYSVTGTSPAGCISINTATSYPYAIAANPTVNITSSSSPLCSGASATLSASGANTYTWSTGGVGTSIAVNPTVTTVYTATGTAVSSCKDTETISLVVNPTPTLTVNNYTICTGGTATLLASGATSYSWSTGATTASIAVTPSSNTNYTVTGTLLGCTNTKTLNVTIGSALGINISPSSPNICIGNSGTLTANGAASYTWSTGSNNTSITISPTLTTTYTLIGTSGSCSGTNTISITISSNPTVSATSSSSLICTGNNATLSAMGANNYNWNPGNISGTQVVVSPSASTIYTVVGTDANNCVNTKTLSLAVSLCTGISEIEKNYNSVSIYPNPNKGEFTLNVPEPGSYLIINAIGQIVQNIEAAELSQNIRLNDFESGIYYLIGRNSKAKIIINK